jgi:S-adenosylmethionine hydrolase
LPIITLLTDYGLKDSYVAEIKGVILNIAPEATIVDISHDVGNYDIEGGAFHLARSVPYFPKGTTHVGVVDPGVGSEQKQIIIEAKNAFFVGPDNGLLAPAAERLGIIKIYQITNREMLPRRVSQVFDGRDVFGPTGAHLANGVEPIILDVEIPSYEKIILYKPIINKKQIEARVIHIDGFGNLVTNVTIEILEELKIKPGSVFSIYIHESDYKIPYVDHFSAVPVGEPLLLVAGGGYLELAVNQGNAKEQLGVKRGEKINFNLLK